jgi:polyadenylation factor subunit 2
MRVGPVTDYGSTTVQWMRNRRPRYKHAAAMEVERPSASYIVDVSELDILDWIED